MLDVYGGSGVNIFNKILRGSLRERGVLTLTHQLNLGVKDGIGFRSLTRVLYNFNVSKRRKRAKSLY